MINGKLDGIGKLLALVEDECEKYRIAIRELEAENKRLREDVEHWREANRCALEAGDMLKAHLEHLRTDVSS
jgi:hypothetical protein